MLPFVKHLKTWTFVHTTTKVRTLQQQIRRSAIEKSTADFEDRRKSTPDSVTIVNSGNRIIIVAMTMMKILLTQHQPSHVRNQNLTTHLETQYKF